MICRRSQLHCLTLLAEPPRVERYQLIRAHDADEAVLQRQQAWLHQQPRALV